MKETKQFQTESKELLNLMINSIYTNKEIFLRELISNASDAIDKYKYQALTSKGEIPSLEYKIDILLDEKKRTITISDNGIGMSKEDLENNLGTIAKSGSKDFMSKIKLAKDKKDIDIIGQFGVGFYSAFMVAKKVEVTTKAFGNEAYKFTSEGESTYTIESAEKEETGTTIRIYLKPNTDDEDYDRFTKTYTIENLVKKYSDYIRYPIKMDVKHSVQDKDEEGKPIEGKYHDEVENKTLNSMVPLWKKNKKEIKDDDLNEFYKSKFSDYEDPLISIFLNIEGNINYSSLLYIPSHLPYNLYSDTYEKGLQLYAKGIFIKDKCPELVPDYLKFVKGLVDSDSFSLNISREMLQTSPVLKKISENIEKKIVDKLKDIKTNDFDKYKKFWETYGEFIKYGIYSTYGMKKDLLQDLLVFHSFLEEDNKFISLKDYCDKLDKKAKNIYYASGENLDSIKLLPQLEKYKKQGIDVLLLDQKIDEFAIMMLQEYDGKKLANIASAEAEEVSQEEKEKLEEVTANYRRFLDNAKEELKDKVDDVVFSSSLVDSPVCIVTKDGMSLEMEKTLNEQPGMEQEAKATKILQINPDHDLFKALSVYNENDDLTKEYASLLYDEAMLLEGHEIKDKQNFVKKLNALLIRSAK